ncbi:MAG: hypothetical protein EOO43_02130 [Flavobacterium sp.]|nr:MAG: hypothetical protein EOO43_02130 [Flavobacterium sp.]
MKEYSANHEKPIPQLKGTKKWLTAITVSRGNEQLKIQNRLVDTDYHRVITAVKNLYMQAGMEVTVFERDYRFDTTECLVTMHSFITPHFYWHLECEYTYNYKVDYDYKDFPFENEFKGLLRAYPLDRTAHHKPKQPSFVAFYKRVLQVQDAKYQYTLKLPGS